MTTTRRRATGRTGAGKRFLFALAFAMSAVALACGGAGDAPAETTADVQATADRAPAAVDAPAGGAALVQALSFLEQRSAYLPQFAGSDDGTLYVVWRERATEGRGGNLFLARRGADGAFGAPVRINHIDGNAGGGSLDEGRAAVDVGPDGTIAVSWAARDGNVRAALSRDGGVSFAPSLKLNADDGERVYRGFGGIAVDRAGVAHAAWIDARNAPPGAEEPADLVYARIDGDRVTEINLTAAQEDSICGCCRVAVDVRADDTVVIAFRNTGGGYRDIFRVEAGADRVFGQPARLGPPMWELLGCPVIGPMNAGEATLWAEASTGKRRILAATATDGSYEVVVEDDDEWAIERPPRLVVGASGDELALLPGRPAGKLLRGSGSAWEVVATGIPRWAMSAVLVGDDLVVMGSIDGAVRVDTVEIS